MSAHTRNTVFLLFSYLKWEGPRV